MDNTTPLSPSAAHLSARPAWNKGKMPGAKPSLRPGQVWAIRANSERATWRCSIWLSTASSAAAISSLCASMTSRPMAMRWTARLCGSERQVGVRADRANAPSAGRLPSQRWPQGRRVLVPRPSGPRSILDDAPVCAPCFRMGERHRARPAEVRHSFDEAHEGDFDLSPNREPPCGAAASRTFEN
jgi:hypothetical protein